MMMTWFKTWRERRYQRRLRAFRERCLRLAIDAGTHCAEATSVANEYAAYCLTGRTRYHEVDGE